ncbi:MAG TPA: PAS domain S-box protein [Solirubrobacteraceae bacterium]|nr:PAS domain S-box protein [Solirubrobacteraceae bacterium]
MMRERGIADRLVADGGELLAALLASMVDAVYAVDGEGRVLFANLAALAVLGYDHERQLLGRDSHATIHYQRTDGRPFPESDCPLLRPRSTGEAVRVEQDWFIRRDGTFVPVAYSSAPMKVGHGRGAVVVFRDISEQHRAEAERRRAEEIRASRARLAQAELEQRRRLGRDLHDGAQHRLVNVIVALQLAAGKTTDDEAGRLIADAVSETQQALEDLRDLASGLHPSVLTDRGLRAAVNSLTARAPVPVTLDLPEARFSPLVEATAYFVVAEALANVAKHADASEASVSVVADTDQLEIVVSDDGRGGVILGGALGSGLAGLEDRVAAIGGTLRVQSPPGAGTRLLVSLPLAQLVSSPAAA